jgi:hypothetical protein
MATPRTTQASAETKLVKIASIVTTTGTQIRAKIDNDTVDQYAEAMQERDSQFPPVVVFHDGSQFILADGFHRVMAATRNGTKSINADVRKGTKADALRYALSANSAHGLRRTNLDKRRSVELALAEWPKLSDREIARICAVGDHLVADARSANCGNPAVEQPRIGRDGKTRCQPANRKVKASRAQTIDVDSAMTYGEVTGKPCSPPTPREQIVGLRPDLADVLRDEPEERPHVVARVEVMPGAAPVTPPPPLASPADQLRREILEVDRQIRELQTKKSELHSKLDAAILLSPNAVTCSSEGCLAVFENDSEAVTLYECADCGQTFTEDDSSDGCSNRCPSCNKFAAKLTDRGCPECSGGELIEVDAAV